MTVLAAAQLRLASDAAVFAFLSDVLKQRITLYPGQPGFLKAANALPPGLGAMACTHHLDVSLTHDDLGWHFGNWHDKELAEATARGLDTLGASELAQVFREAYAHALKYWHELGESGWSQWYSGSPLEEAVEPLNTRAWALLDSKWNGVLGYWVEYARAHPLEVGAAHDA